MPEPNPATPPRPTADRGTALLLLPAAIVLLTVLGALTVDGAAALLTRRQLAAIAATAANEAATAALDTHRFHLDGTYTVDPVLARTLVEARVAAHPDPHINTASVTDVQVEPTADPAAPVRVTVTLTGRAPTVFLPAVSDTLTTITATATATALVAG